MKPKRQVVVVSPLSFLYLLLAVALVWVVIQTAGIIISLFAAGIFAIALNHSVNYFERKFHIRRGLAVALIMVLFLILMVIVAALVIPSVVSQVNTIVDHWPEYQAKTRESLSQQPTLMNAYNYLAKNLGNSWGDYSKNLFNYLSGALGSLLTVFTFFIFLIYLLVSGKHFLVYLADMMPNAQTRKRFLHISQDVSNKLGYWLRGQVILCLIVGVAAYVLLLSLGIPFALTLAVLAGIFEAVPMVGAYLGAIPAVLVALTVSPTRAIFVAVGFLIMQQLEGNIVVPQVMRRAIGVHPMVILLAAMVGGTLFGFVGVLIAVPVTAAASVILGSLKDEVIEKATAHVVDKKENK